MTWVPWAVIFVTLGLVAAFHLYEHLYRLWREAEKQRTEAVMRARVELRMSAKWTERWFWIGTIHGVAILAARGLVHASVLRAINDEMVRALRVHHRARRRCR